MVSVSQHSQEGEVDNHEIQSTWVLSCSCKDVDFTKLSCYKKKQKQKKPTKPNQQPPPPSTTKKPSRRTQREPRENPGGPKQYKLLFF